MPLLPHWQEGGCNTQPRGSGGAQEDTLPPCGVVGLSPGTRAQLGKAEADPLGCQGAGNHELPLGWHQAEPSGARRTLIH